MFPDTCQAIHRTLEASLSPHSLEVVDNSHLHVGHAGAKENPGQGHFHVRIGAQALQGRNMVQQHRLIYAALTAIMSKIHALEITILP
jgi:BolA protein